MKVLAVVATILSMWGIIWGIFFPAFLWLACAGLCIMGGVLIFDREEN